MTDRPSPARQATIDSLKNMGVDMSLAEEEQTDVAATLIEPQYSETVLGELTADERVLFSKLKTARESFERLQREYAGRQLSRFGDQLRRSDVHKPIHEVMQGQDPELVFDSQEEKAGFFRLERQIALLHSNLYWSLAERFNVHEWGLGVRSRWRAVRTAERG